ncbi:MAG TPA: hypothetical protein VGB00_17670 [Pyrinomonadaceae bacterium]|jgi:hypothetical protein
MDGQVSGIVSAADTFSGQSAADKRANAFSISKDCGWLLSDQLFVF